MNRVIEIAKNIRPSALTEFKTYDIATLQIFWRCYSLCRAIILLLREKFAEEALALSRALFTDSLNLSELAEVGDRRAELALGWMNRSYEEMKGLVRNAHRLGIENNPTETLNGISRQQSDLQAYASRIGVKRLRKFRPELDAAKRYDRQDDYLTYLISHEMVHGSDIAFLFRRRKLANGSLALFAQTSDAEALDAVAAFAALSLLAAISSVASIYSWPLPTDFESLRQKIKELSTADDPKP